MIEKLDPNDARPHTIIAKVNEVIDVINDFDNRLMQLEQNFDNHHHSYEDHTTGGPTVVMVDEREVRDGP